jgi:hypothetical protein
LEASGGVLLVAAAIVQIAGGGGANAVRSIVLTAATIVVGGAVLILAGRMVPAMRKIPISYLVVASSLAAGAVGGYAGYRISAELRAGSPATAESSRSPNTPVPSNSATSPPAPSGTASRLPSPAHSPLPDGIMVSRYLKLNSANFCSWRIGIHPMPLASINPIRIRIDGRCNYPQHPNPATDGPTGIYSSAQQNSAYAVARLRDGTVLTLTCYTFGQQVSDAIGNGTSIWLGVALPTGGRGYVPDVNAGTYSTAQLTGLGVSLCA